MSPSAEKIKREPASPKKHQDTKAPLREPSLQDIEWIKHPSTYDAANDEDGVVAIAPYTEANVQCLLQSKNMQGELYTSGVSLTRETTAEGLDVLKVISSILVPMTAYEAQQANTGEETQLLKQQLAYTHGQLLNRENEVNALAQRLNGVTGFKDQEIGQLRTQCDYLVGQLNTIAGLAKLPQAYGPMQAPPAAVVHQRPAHRHQRMSTNSLDPRSPLQARVMENNAQVYAIPPRRNQAPPNPPGPNAGLYLDGAVPSTPVREGKSAEQRTKERTAYYSAMRKFEDDTPSTQAASLMDGCQTRRSEETVSNVGTAADDVFAINPVVPPATVRHISGYQDPQPKTYTVLLNWCFTNIETVIAKVPINEVIQALNFGNSDAASFLEACQEHLLNRKEAYTLLKHPHYRYVLVTGRINRFLCDHIFNTNILAGFKSVHKNEFAERFEAESQAASGALERNYPARHELARKRAEVAAKIVKLPGFWKYMDVLANNILRDIMPKIKAVIPDACVAPFQTQMVQQVRDLIGVAVRTLQDPRRFEVWFPRVGVKWNENYHLHRNPELQGVRLDEPRTPYTVHCTIFPLVKVADYVDGCSIPRVIHRAEVLINGDKIKLKAIHKLGEDPYRPGYQHSTN